MLRRFVLALAAAALALPAARAGDPLLQRVYPVGDLVVPAPAGAPDPQKLIRTITTQVAPASWVDKGGAGTVDYLPIGMSLVVHQTPAVHEQVVQLLESLRWPRCQIAFEVRLLAISDECYAALGRPGAAGATIILSDDEALTLLTKAQADRHTTLLQSPRVTTLEGQNAVVQVKQEHAFVTGVDRVEVQGIPCFVPTQESLSSGLVLALRGTVLPNSGDIAVRVKVDVSHVQGSAPLFPVATFITPVFDDGARGKPIPFTQHVQQPTQMTCGVTKVLAIPPGRTAAFGAGRRAREIVEEAKVPVLGDLPILGDFFTARTSHTETENIVVLLTPKVGECGGGESPVVPPLAPAAVRMDVTTFSVCDCFWANTHGPAAKLATENVAFIGGDGQAFRDALRECGGCTIYAEPRMLTPVGRPASFAMGHVVTTFTPTVSADETFVKVAGTVWGLEAAAGTPALPTLTVPDGNAVVYKLGRDCASGATLYALVSPRRVSATGGEESEPPLVAIVAAYRKACADWSSPSVGLAVSPCG